MRLLHLDGQAAPITRAMAERWPTFTEVERAQRAPAAPRLRRDVPRIVREYDDSRTPAWDAFDQALGDEETFAAFLERLGAEVHGTSVCMPGDPAWSDPNREFHASIWPGDSGCPVLTIHGTGTCAWWAAGSDRQTFGAYDLLCRVFDGDSRAAARYVFREVLPDVEEWLDGFSWSPGEPAPSVTNRAARSPEPRREPAATECAEPTPVAPPAESEAPAVKPEAGPGSLTVECSSCGDEFTATSRFRRLCDDPACAL